MDKMPLCRFSVALFMTLAMGVPVAGLTIYRLGGENLPPPPEVERGEADLRQFSWADIEAARLGSGESLIIGVRRDFTVVLYRRGEHCSDGMGAGRLFANSGLPSLGRSGRYTADHRPRQGNGVRRLARR